jgi:hypothetical protein
MDFNSDERCTDGDSETDLVCRRPWTNGKYSTALGEIFRIPLAGVTQLEHQ